MRYTSISPSRVPTITCAVLVFVRSRFATIVQPISTGFSKSYSHTVLRLNIFSMEIMSFVLTNTRDHDLKVAMASRINYNLFSFANYLIYCSTFLFFYRTSMFCCSSTLFPTNSFSTIETGITLVYTVMLLPLIPAHESLGTASV